MKATPRTRTDGGAGGGATGDLGALLTVVLGLITSSLSTGSGASSGIG
ncbi:hypothetical protein [Nocardia bovistercoris]|uniref:Uncharacterized protein n=1 Tax=Nocardia bovistercoris TaxID=2785916 RepID=A0A931IFF9_9NOCA|nr:hypothetical protein [Nocardia bovistercoris]MBH0778713.1 hypothetical protein [Nocardia bovistercoris]